MPPKKQRSSTARARKLAGYVSSGTRGVASRHLLAESERTQMSQCPATSESNVDGPVTPALPSVIAEVVPSIVDQVTSHLSAQFCAIPSREVVQGEPYVESDVQNIPSLDLVQHNVDQLPVIDHILVADDVEDDSLTYTLSPAEGIRVRDQAFIDFGAVYHRHKASPFALALVDNELQGAKKVYHDIPILEWVRIFAAFMAEHVRYFPQDSTHMPRYMDRVVSLALTQGCWSLYDVTYRMRRAKRAASVPHSVRPWSVPDMELLFTCSQLDRSVEPSHP